MKPPKDIWRRKWGGLNLPLRPTDGVAATIPLPHHRITCHYMLHHCMPCPPNAHHRRSSLPFDAIWSPIPLPWRSRWPCTIVADHLFRKQIHKVIYQKTKNSKKNTNKRKCTCIHRFYTQVKQKNKSQYIHFLKLQYRFEEELKAHSCQVKK